MAHGLFKCIFRTLFDFGFAPVQFRIVTPFSGTVLTGTSMYMHASMLKSDLPFIKNKNLSVILGQAWLPWFYMVYYDLPSFTVVYLGLPLVYPGLTLDLPLVYCGLPWFILDYAGLP